MSENPSPELGNGPKRIGLRAEMRRNLMKTGRVGKEGPKAWRSSEPASTKIVELGGRDERLPVQERFQKTLEHLAQEVGLEPPSIARVSEVDKLMDMNLGADNEGYHVELFVGDTIDGQDGIAHEAAHALVLHNNPEYRQMAFDLADLLNKTPEVVQGEGHLQEIADLEFTKSLYEEMVGFYFGIKGGKVERDGQAMLALVEKINERKQTNRELVGSGTGVNRAAVREKISADNFVAGKDAGGLMAKILVDSDISAKHIMLLKPNDLKQVVTLIENSGEVPVDQLKAQVLERIRGFQEVEAVVADEEYFEKIGNVVGDVGEKNARKVTIEDKAIPKVGPSTIDEPKQEVKPPEGDAAEHKTKWPWTRLGDYLRERKEINRGYELLQVEYGEGEEKQKLLTSV